MKKQDKDIFIHKGIEKVEPGRWAFKIFKGKLIILDISSATDPHGLVPKMLTVDDVEKIVLRDMTQT